MSYVVVIAGVLERLRTVQGLRHVQNGLPTAAQVTPMAYTLFDSSPVSQTGQVVAFRYMIPITVAVPWQENETAEDELAPFINSVPFAFDPVAVDTGGHPHATLGGRIPMGIARVIDIRSGEGAGFITIGGVICRCATFMLEVVDKGPTGSEV